MKSADIHTLMRPASLIRRWSGPTKLAWTILAVLLPCAARASEISIDQLRERHEKWRTAILSLEYSADIHGRVFNTPPGVVRRLHRTYRAMEGHRFLENQHLWPNLDWNDDLKWARTWLRPARVDVLSVLDRHCVTSEKYSLRALNHKLGDVEHDIYLACAGWWPAGRHSAPPESVHASLTQEDWSIDRTRAEIDGRECVVLTRNDSAIAETLWLDAGRECVVVRRVFVNSERGSTFLVENSDFREAAPGIFLPWKIYRNVTVSASGPRNVPPPKEPQRDLESEIFSRSLLELQTLRINHLDSASFAPDLPPGTIVVDYDSNESRILPGGRELVLDDMVRVSSKLIRAARSSASQSFSLLWTPFFAAAGMLLRLGTQRWSRCRD